MHIALLAPDLAGHLNPMTTLGRELARRGHRVSVISSPKASHYSERAGLELLPYGVPEYESGERDRALAKLANLTGFAGLKFTGQLLAQDVALGLRDIPSLCTTHNVEGVVVDQVSPAGVSVCEALKLPFAFACNALAMHQEPAVPPPTLPWAYRPGPLGRMRNRLGNTLLRIAVRPIFGVVRSYRQAHGLPRQKFGQHSEIGLAQVAQQPSFFDFPRQRLPSHFHYTGPWHEAGRDPTADFPWEKLDGRPLIYASLGTLQNRLKHVFAAILEGCAAENVQLVLSLGRAGATWDGPVPANALVVPFAPQLDLIDRATAVITHAGLNTALETLARGKPMLCIPVTNDQPGVATRVAYLGAGLVVRPGQVTAAKVRTAVRTLSTNPEYRTASQDCAKKMANANGLQRAAEIVEEALTTGKRVERRE